MFIIYFLIFIFWLCISLYLAEQFYEVAKEKGYDDRKYFQICFWLGLPGYLLVIALPNRANLMQTLPEELPDL
jgi:hypothetical protein